MEAILLVAYFTPSLAGHNDEVKESAICPAWASLKMALR
jgi:hypothetical protein